MIIPGLILYVRATSSAEKDIEMRGRDGEVLCSHSYIKALVEEEPASNRMPNTFYKKIFNEEEEKKKN